MSDIELDSNNNVVETLKSCDRIVKKQVASVKRIRRRIFILNVFMSIVAVPIAYLVDENAYTLLDYNAYYTFTFVLFHSRMRSHLHEKDNQEDFRPERKIHHHPLDQFLHLHAAICVQDYIYFKSDRLV